MLVNATGDIAETLVEAVEDARASCEDASQDSRLPSDHPEDDGEFLETAASNAISLSEELIERDIPHELHYGGLKPLICNHDGYKSEYTSVVSEHGFGEEALHSWSELDGLMDWPETVDELPEHTDHYWVEIHKEPVTNHGLQWGPTAETLVAEVACRRRDAFSEPYIGPIPDEYIRLEDGLVKGTESTS